MDHVFKETFVSTQAGLMSQHVGWSAGREPQCPPGETKQTLSATFTELPKRDQGERKVLD